MNTVEKLTTTLGRPQALRELVTGRCFLGAVGRWQHQGAQVNLGATDTAQLIFNVSGGQRVTLRREVRETHGVIRAGSLGIVLPGRATRVTVVGRADTVQIIVSQALIESVADASTSLLPSRSAGNEARIRAVAAQALVELTRDRRESRAELDKIIRQVACWFARQDDTPPAQLARGGLSPAARRRVHALMEERLRAEWCSPLSLRELARAAGLSVPHFVRAFRQTEGRTPHADVIARRLDLALTLLLQPKARVDWVAGQTGFSSPAHFVSAFRRRLGVTPGALRDAADARR